jgi:hypothetical protein
MLFGTCTHDGMDVHIQTYYTKVQPCLGHALLSKYDHVLVLEVRCVTVPIFGSRDMGHMTWNIGHGQGSK